MKTGVRLYNSYVIPRALYGLEAVKITETAKTKLATFHKYVLRCILGLPKWTATPALYIISGQLPIELQMDVRSLSFLRSLMSIDPTRDILLRQFVVKSSSSNSLAISFTEKLHQYHLPSIYDLYIDIPDKLKWKKEVKRKVISNASENISEDASVMSTLKFLHKEFKYNESHPVAQFVQNTRQVTRACIKIMVLTGTYPLQISRFKMKKVDSALCPLCHQEEEDTEHFIESCSKLRDTRQAYKARLNALLPTPLLTSPTQAILDSRHLMTLHPATKILVKDLEEVTRDMIFALHMKRSTLLNISSHIKYYTNPLPRNPLLN